MASKEKSKKMTLSELKQHLRQLNQTAFIVFQFIGTVPNPVEIEELAAQGKVPGEKGAQSKFT